MATSVSQDKRPNEKIRIAADFSHVLVTGDSLIGGNITVTSKNDLTDSSTTSTIIAATALSGTTIVATVQAGTAGETHVITFSTGTTTLGLSYETQVNLVITTSPAAETPLISLNSAKLHLQVADSSDDALIEDLLLSASAYIRRRTGRDFTALTYTEVLQPMEGDDIVRLQLSNYPVRQVDRVYSVDVDGTVLWDTSSNTDWDFLPEGYVWMTAPEVYSFQLWPNKNYVLYRAGYPKIPEDLSRCCAQIVASLYRAIGRENLSQERIGNYMYMTAGPKDMPKSLRREFSDTQIEGVISRYMKHDLYLVGV